MPKLKKDIQTPEQIFAKNRYEELYRLAKVAGFDEDGLVYSEFSLMPFFDLIIEQCAQVAEKQSRTYTGENNEGRGSSDAAIAIRAFGRNLGNESN